VAHPQQTLHHYSQAPQHCRDPQRHCQWPRHPHRVVHHQGSPHSKQGRQQLLLQLVKEATSNSTNTQRLTGWLLQVVARGPDDHLPAVAAAGAAKPVGK